MLCIFRIYEQLQPSLRDAHFYFVKPKTFFFEIKYHDIYFSQEIIQKLFIEGFQVYNFLSKSTDLSDTLINGTFF